MLLSLTQLLTQGRASAHPVLHAESGLMCWGEFAAEFGRRAAYLQQQSATRWLLACESSAEFALWLMALCLSGKQIVLPPNLQAGTLAQMAADCDAVIGTRTATDWQRVAAPLPPRVAEAGIELYTSGSTGQPKRISKTLAQLEREIAVLESLWGESMGTATVIAMVPHHHIYGLLFRVLWPLAAGRAFDCTLCAHPDTLQQRSAALVDTVLVASPAQLSRLPELMELADWQPQPRLIFSSGGPLTAHTAAQLAAALGTAPLEVYGSTETGGMAWRCQSEDARWQPLPGVRLHSEADATLLHSPFLDAPARLDDVIELAADGRFSLLGRRDRIVKVEEKRLSLAELEQRLVEHNWVAQARALVLTDKRQRVAVLVQLNVAGQAELAQRGRKAVSRALREYLAAFYDAVLLPRHWRYVAEMPYNAQGKLPQAAVAALFAEREQDEHVSA